MTASSVDFSHSKITSDLYYEPLATTDEATTSPSTPSRRSRAESFATMDKATTPTTSPSSSSRHSRAKSLTEAVAGLFQSTMSLSPSNSPSCQRCQSPKKSSTQARLRKPLPAKLVSVLQLKKMKYNDSREAISKMYDLFDLPHGSVEYEKILKGLGQTIDRNLEAHEVLRLRRKVLDHRLRDGTINYLQCSIPTQDCTANA